MRHILILFVLLFSVSAHAAEWKPLDYREPGVNIFLDQASVRPSTKLRHTIVVWVKQVFVVKQGTTEHITYLYSINCPTQQYMVLKMIRYSSPYTAQAPFVQNDVGKAYVDIIPDTLEDIVYDYICSK